MKKLTIYLKSGQTIKLKCADATFTFDRRRAKYVGYSIEGATTHIGINPNEIAAWTAEEAMF